MEGDIENVAGVGGTPCQDGGRRARHKEQKETISKKPGAAERSHHVQELLHCLTPHQWNWGDARLTQDKKEGKFVLEAEGRQVFPPGAC